MNLFGFKATTKKPIGQQQKPQLKPYLSMPKPDCETSKF
jgi:hypothetical protein